MCAHLRSIRAAAAAMLLVLFAVPRTGGAQSPESPPDSFRALGDRRIVHVFDFDERDDGNLESVPMFWRAQGGEGFPAYARGRFDTDVGRDAPPAFFLDANGRNVRYLYDGPQIPTRVNSDYLVTAWIQPRELRHARAALSAFFVDSRGVPLVHTERFSRLVGGATETADWQKIDLLIPAAPASATRLGLRLWVVQEDQWRSASAPRRHIKSLDVRAGAWFDDIVIRRLPSALLSTNAAGNVLSTVRPGGAERPPALLVRVHDRDTDRIEARLRLFDAAGDLLLARQIPVGTGTQAALHQIPLTGFGPGLYRARLAVSSDDTVLLARRLTLALLAPSYGRPVLMDRSFGVVLSVDGRADAATELALVNQLGVGSVKIPMWDGSLGRSDGLSPATDIDDLLYGLVERNVTPIGVLAGPAPERANAPGVHPLSLVELLRQPPASWRPLLSRVIAPYVSMFHGWQVGADDHPIDPMDEKALSVVTAVRRELATLVNNPVLQVSVRSDVEGAVDHIPGDGVTLAIPSDVHPAWIAEHLRGAAGADRRDVGAYLESEEDPSRARLAALTHWMKRLVYTYSSGPKTVWVRQPWSTRPTPTGPVTEPTERYLLNRTAADLLSGSIPGGTLNLEDGIRCLVFHHGAESVLVIWDRYAPRDGRTYAINLGPASRQIDMWGRAVPLTETTDGRRQIRLSAQPVFVDHVDRWLVQFRQALTLTPERLEFRIGPQEQVLTLSNPRQVGISGRMVLEIPDEWSITPRTIEFNLAPGAELRRSIQIRYPQSEPAGAKTITAIVQFEDDLMPGVSVPLRFELGISDVDVWGSALADGANLILRHAVTNRSHDVLNFRTFATVPGRRRQYRVIPELRPDQTAVKRFRITGGAAFTGQTIRLTLKEIGGPRWHNLDVVVP